jgi:dTDP-glucose 4,6-dehydratase
MSMKGKTVLVTGAGGFTGSHLSRALVKQGVNVRAYVKRGSPLTNLSDIINQVQLIKGDIQDYTNLSNAMKGVDFVFHVAAIVPVHESRDLPYLSTQVNTVGTFNVAWSAVQAGVKKLLYTSTCHVYGNQPDSQLPIKETATPNPLDIYSATKYAGEILLKQFTNINGIDIVITRAFNKYGPNQVGDWLFPRTIRKVLTQSKIKVGNPNSTRDYSYIEDVVQGYIIALEKGKNGDIFNLGSGKENSIKKIVDKIIAASGRNVSVEWETFREVDILRSFGDCSNAKKALGWEVKTSLDEGIRKTVEWWKQHPELLK